MKSPSAATKPARTKNWLLVESRKWHTWGGLIASLFVITTCLTGIYLNHANLFAGKGMEEEHKLSGALTTTTALQTVPVSFDQAMQKAREHWGNIPIEKIELKDEHGELVYKLKAGEGRDLDVSATTGAVTLKGKLAQKQFNAEGKVVAAGINWKKTLNDLHTGKLLGGPGKLLIDLTSLTLLLLTLSGIYLWLKPKLLKREKQRATPPLKPVVVEKPVREVAA